MLFVHPTNADHQVHVGLPGCMFLRAAGSDSRQQECAGRIAWLWLEGPRVASPHLGFLGKTLAISVSPTLPPRLTKSIEQKT